tara:strand:+ start:1216 stop:1335 length:120 start_codon:yes stop_codon:yes gene_type:complete
MYVHWFDWVSGNGVNGVQDLPHFDQVAVVAAVAVASALP